MRVETLHIEHAILFRLMVLTATFNMHFCQRCYNHKEIAFNTYNYTFTFLNTIESIIILFNIPHFQLLFLCVAFSYHDVRKSFPEVSVAE